MHEERRARLHRLADSINDTALMARTSLSIMLLVALYLGLTMVASTDENLFLNGQVTLPQAGVGISVVQSYLFAPPVFFYLHIQLLFLLSVLARKIRTFEGALKKEFPDALLPHLQNKTDAERRECWEWLSAFAFVQLFRQTPGGRRVLQMVARTLVWFGIEAAPLALLFLIAVSFVRYQSAGITWSHHCIFILDSVAIIIFNRFVFRRRGSASVSGGVPGNAGVPSAFGVGQWPALLGRIDRLMHYRMWWKHLRGLSAIRLNWRILVRSAKVMPARLWTSVGGTGIVALCMGLLLICYAHPPQFNPQSVEDDRGSIWRVDNKGFWQAVRKNPLDAGPCDLWRFGCRYLDLSSNKWLLGTQPQGLVAQISDESTSKAGEDIRRFPNISGRRLRFARFGFAYLPGVDLRQTELQGADLGEAELQGADLTGAQLQGADLRRAKLQRSRFWGAQLQGALLWGAQLQGADLWMAQLQGENLEGAQLQGADLWEAKLQGANLKGAGLQGARLQKAKLQGANLRGAKLKGANLRETGLQGADLTKVELQGTNLGGAKLQGSKGQPDQDSWYLTWMPDVKFNRSSSRGIFGGAKPEKKDRVFHTLKDPNWPDAPDVDSDYYWDAWAEWTADFACENEYTARSSLQRWSLSRSSDTHWHRDAPDSLFFLYEKKVYDRVRDRVREVRNKVREALLNARGEPKCAGLRGLSENEW